MGLEAACLLLTLLNPKLEFQLHLLLVKLLEINLGFSYLLKVAFLAFY